MKLLTVKTVEEVKKIIIDNFQSIEKYEELELDDCLSRVLGQDIYAPETLPPFSRSSVDGYAVNASDTYGASESLPAFLEFTGEITMGTKAELIKFGQTRYIPTGGMLPPGADAVVMVEFTEKLADQVMLYRQVGPGENVIKAGDDVNNGDFLISKGVVLKEAELGSLAALGINSVSVFKKPVVGIISTGNELVPRNTGELQKGQIRDINTIILSSIAKKLGADVIEYGITNDKYDQIYEKASRLLPEVDILLLSGGSSVGTLDFTSQVLEKLSNKNVLVEGIAIKPGKPTLLAKIKNKAILGLPGHPVSAMMIFSYFGEILIDILRGSKDIKVKKICTALLTRNIPSSAGRTDWVRVKLEFDNNSYKATPVFGKSGLITTLIGTQGYIEIPPHKEGLEGGSTVEVVFWS
ncbi:MAG: molybdenum cofactor biosynthesis protein [Clostridiaceae bacterium BRH_c20a]|nr:MAG: molybdenum cofactor biosynthesis protein [Clostridiaceae bacterium BRH_c20a]